MRWLILVAAAALAASPEVRAQNAAVLRPGSLVRFVRADNSDRLVGRLIAAEGDTMTVLVHDAAFAWRVPMSSLRQLDVSHRLVPRSESAGRGAAVGVLAGSTAAALALALGLLAPDNDRIEQLGSHQKAKKFLRLTVLWGAAGGTAGGIFGTLYPGRVWQRVPLPVARAAPGDR